MAVFLTDPSWNIPAAEKPSEMQRIYRCDLGDVMGNSAMGEGVGAE